MILRQEFIKSRREFGEIDKNFVTLQAEQSEK
jgi:hypothetical protein